jgi:hypothetical protein
MAHMDKGFATLKHGVTGTGTVNGMGRYKTLIVALSTPYTQHWIFLADSPRAMLTKGQGKSKHRAD